MATITNLSKWKLSIQGIGKHVAPNTTEQISDDDARKWEHGVDPEKPRANALVLSGKAIISYDKKARKAPTNAPEKTETGREHYKLAISKVKTLTDMDELEQVHETDDRPSVLAAVEVRMEELRALAHEAVG